MMPRFCCALAPDYERTERGYYIRQGVYCTTDKYQFPTEERPYGYCRLHKTKTHWKQCSPCLDKLDISTAGICGPDVIAIPSVSFRSECCRKGDWVHEARNETCRECHQKLACLVHSIRSTKKRKLRLVE